jgi:hypothetical protein
METKHKQVNIDEALVTEAYKVSNAANTHKIYSLLHVYINSAELINDENTDICLKGEFQDYFMSASIELKKFILNEKLNDPYLNFGDT